MFFITFIRKHMKLSVALLIVIVLILAACLYYDSHPTWYKYNDKWILGRDIHEVEKRYGKFDYVYGKPNNYSRAAYYLYKSHLIDDEEIWYTIYCDENGKVIRIYCGGGFPGPGG